MSLPSHKTLIRTLLGQAPGDRDLRHADAPLLRDLFDAAEDVNRLYNHKDAVKRRIPLHDLRRADAVFVMADEPRVESASWMPSPQNEPY